MTKRELLKELHSFSDDSEVFIVIKKTGSTPDVLRELEHVHAAADYMEHPADDDFDKVALVVVP